MISIAFQSLPSDLVRAFQSGAADAYGRAPEHHISDGSGIPCRHCQTDVETGAPFLILAHCPFPEPQPYAETGPIFLHAEPCPAYPEDAGLPDMFLRRENYLLKGYGEDHRIVYGTGRIVPSPEIRGAALDIFERPEVAYIHARSALNNCYQCRIARA